MGLRLMAVGDIFLQRKDGTGDPFAHVKDTFAQADVVFGNLEVPVTDAARPGIEQAVILKSSPDGVPYLRDANFSVLNLAHNHIRDYGAEGALDTIRHLDAVGLRHIGAGDSIAASMKETVVDVDGTTVAFAGFYSHGEGLSTGGLYVAGMSPQLVRHRIAELASRYDRVVVSLHWGRENIFYPAPEQQEFARMCIDEGASVVLGHHPHYLHGVEAYNGGVIFYSLGNFNFWQFGMKTDHYHRLTCIADIDLSGESVTHDLIPVMIDDDYCPRPVTAPGDVAAFDAHMKEISALLPGGIDKWWWFGQIGKPYLVNNGRSFLVRIRRYGIGHAFAMARWLTSRFVIKCYVGLIRRYFGLGRQSPKAPTSR